MQPNLRMTLLPLHSTLLFCFAFVDKFFAYFSLALLSLQFFLNYCCSRKTMSMGVITLSPVRDTTILLELKGYRLYLSHLYGTYWRQIMERACEKGILAGNALCNAAEQWGEPLRSPRRAILWVLLAPVPCSGTGSTWNNIKVQNMGFWSQTLPQFMPIALLFFPFESVLLNAGIADCS